MTIFTFPVAISAYLLMSFGGTYVSLYFATLLQVNLNLFTHIDRREIYQGISAGVLNTSTLIFLIHANQKGGHREIAIGLWCVFCYCGSLCFPTVAGSYLLEYSNLNIFQAFSTIHMARQEHFCLSLHFRCLFFFFELRFISAPQERRTQH